MSNYAASKEVSRRGLVILERYARDKNIDLVPLDNQTYMQLVYGDYLMKHGDKVHAAVEVKTERCSPTNSLFVEVWSNRRWERQGWFYTFRSDELWYYFLDPDDLYIIDAVKFREWGNAALGDAPYLQKNQEHYPLRMAVCDQKNDTWGRLVPIETMRNARLIIDHVHPRAANENAEPLAVV